MQTKNIKDFDLERLLEKAIRPEFEKNKNDVKCRIDSRLYKEIGTIIETTITFVISEPYYETLPPIK